MYSLFPPVTRMMSDDFLAQTRIVEMEINLGSGDRFMAEHGLNGAQIGPSFKQMCGE